MVDGLDCCKELTIKEFADFLSRAKQYDETGIVPTKAKPSKKAATVDPELITRTALEVMDLYERAIDESLSYAAIENRNRQAKQALGRHRQSGRKGSRNHRSKIEKSRHRSNQPQNLRTEGKFFSGRVFEVGLNELAQTPEQPLKWWFARIPTWLGGTENMVMGGRFEVHQRVYIRYNAGAWQFAPSVVSFEPVIRDAD